MSLQSNIIASVVRSTEPDRTQPANSRVAGQAQDQIAAMAVVETTKKKVRASDNAGKAKIKKDRDSQGDSHGSGEHPHGQAYGSDGHAGTVGEEPEGHVIDALA